jgi:ribosome biogenesis protein MAK21
MTSLSKKPFIIPFPQQKQGRQGSTIATPAGTAPSSSAPSTSNKVPHQNKAGFQRPNQNWDKKDWSKASVKSTAAANDNNGGGKPSASSSTKQTWWSSTDAIKDHQEEEGSWFDEIPAIFQQQNAEFASFVPGSDVYSKILAAVETAYKTIVIKVAKEKKNTSSKSDQNWVNETIKSGTLSDKIAALALKIQESPFLSLDLFDELVSIACKKDQRAAQHALEAIKDLLINNLLPDYKLTVFAKQPLLHPKMDMNTALLLWYEGQVKEKMSKLLSALDQGLKSNQDYFKRICMELAKDLLVSKPEEEARLLAMLVNKLGDPAGTACAKCIEHLKAVIKTHPAMKLIIVREVRQFLSRPDMKLRSIYNGVIFLSNVNLTAHDNEVATQLVQCYMGLFHQALKEDDMGSRLLSALLTGVNRSLPYLSNTESLSSHVDALFLVVHTASFSSATQALILLSHIALKAAATTALISKKDREKGQTHKKQNQLLHAADEELAKRFYRALYARLLSDQVAIHSKNTAFLNLLYRSIKGDPLERR